MQTTVTIGGRIELASWPVAHPTGEPGKYHPGFHSAGRVFYWPNITKHTELEAEAYAEKALVDALTCAEDHAKLWNVAEALVDVQEQARDK